MPYIESAYQGRIKMLKAIFGGSDPAPTKPATPSRKMSPALFDALFPGSR